MENQWHHRTNPIPPWLLRGRQCHPNAFIRCLFFLVITTAHVSVASGGILEGRIRDKDGNQMANVRVDLTGPAKRLTVTDQNGAFRLEAPGGDYRLLVTYRGNRKSINISIPPGDDIVSKTFTLNQ
jgi:hypothetical protein